MSEESPAAVKPKGAMPRMLVLLAGAILLFVAGLVSTLGARGKLTAEYLGPLIGKKPMKEAEVHEGMTKSAAATILEGNEPAANGTHAGAKHEGEREMSDAFAGVSLPSPFSSDETRDLFRDLNDTRGALKEKLTSVDHEQKDLELIRLDLSRRWDELNHREEELEERSKSLVAERVELDSRQVVMKEAELENLKKVAGDLEKMPAEAAAKILAVQSVDRVAQLLTFVKPREAGKILAALDPAFAAKVNEKELSVLKPASAAGTEGN